MDEKQAIARLKCGNIDGLEELVGIYQIQAVRAAFLIVGDRKHAEDIVQSAFIRASEKISQFDDQRPFGPWFLRSVVNDAIKAAKRQKREISLDVDDGEGILILTDPTSLPEDLLVAEETSHAIWRALLSLPPNQRSAIVLRYYLEMNEDEMSKKMQSPRGTIKYWLHAAKHRLRVLLHPEQSSGLIHNMNEDPTSADMPETGDKL